MIGLTLRVARFRARITQRDVAEYLGISCQFVSAVECGTKKAPRGFVRKYRAAVRELVKKQHDAATLGEPREVTSKASLSRRSLAKNLPAMADDENPMRLTGPSVADGAER
jgi:transcriptional regulator with XRE-family HTH domain